MDKQKMEQIIALLKKYGEANRKDIGKYIGDEQYSDKLKSYLNYLESGKYIQKLSEEIYRITPKGERFVSFAQEIENEELEIRLAKSNIEANELQKRNSKRNNVAMWINLFVGIINLGIIILQLLKVV
jgi:predicted transcriptional regulator